MKNTHKSTLIISKIFTPDPFNVIKRVNRGRSGREERNLQLNRKGLFACFLFVFKANIWLLTLTPCWVHLINKETEKVWFVGVSWVICLPLGEDRVRWSGTLRFLGHVAVLIWMEVSPVWGLSHDLIWVRIHIQKENSSVHGCHCFNLGRKNRGQQSISAAPLSQGRLQGERVSESNPEEAESKNGAVTNWSQIRWW